MSILEPRQIENSIQDLAGNPAYEDLLDTLAVYARVVQKLADISPVDLLAFEEQFGFCLLCDHKLGEPNNLDCAYILAVDLRYPAKA